MYKRDLFDVSHREYTTGFFFSSGAIDTADVSRPTSYGYERNYIFLGSVREKTGDNTYLLDIRNQIKKGDNLEFIGPDVPLLSDTDFTLLDGEGNEVEQLDHGKAGSIRTSLPLKEGYIMRKLSENGSIVK